jgi:hypothetical protein
MRFLLFPLLFVLMGCQSPSPGEVNHIVLCWLKEPGRIDHRQALIDQSHGFRTLPGVLRVEAGPPLPSSRPFVDSSYDIAVILTFANEQALRAYEAHPAHQKAVREVLLPLTRQVRIYDFKIVP